MFLVLRVADRFKEIDVAPNPTAVLWRAGTFTFHAHRVFFFGINGRAG